FWDEGEGIVEHQKEDGVCKDASAFVESRSDLSVQSGVMDASRNDNIEGWSQSPPLSESKLFRRFQDNDIGSSKLGRHFTKSALCNSINPQVQKNGISDPLSLSNNAVVERQLKE